MPKRNPDSPVDALLSDCRQLVGRILELEHRGAASRERRAALERAARHLEHGIATLEDQASAEQEPPLPRQRAPKVSPLDRDAFQGSSGAISLPDLLGFLQWQEHDGILRVATPKEVLSLRLDGGELCDAISDRSPPGLRLGEILVERACLSADALGEFLRRHEGDERRIGQALEASQLVSRDSVQEALEYQVQALFNRLFQTDDAYFTFRTGQPRTDGLVRMGLNKLLLESARLSDENGLMESA